MNSNATIRYNYKSLWDNRFNETTFVDSASIIYVTIDDSPLGFGFYASNYEDEFIFDGTSYSEINHVDKLIVKHDSEEIRKDSTYFSNNTYFFSTPMEFSASIEFKAVIDTVILGRKYFVYKEEDLSRSDDTRIIEDHRYYYIDRDSSIVRQIKKLTIIDDDTLQIIDHYFSFYSFATQAVNFNGLSTTEFLSYPEIGVDDLVSERHTKQISVGDTVSDRTCQSINNSRITLFDHTMNQSLIMFSFIGCGGCEYAMREMKKENYQTSKDLNLYYSSPVDSESPLKSYLSKKKFPHEAFSKESKMNDEFSIYFFPTFVLIDSQGVVTSVVQGYGDDVHKMLFED